MLLVFSFLLVGIGNPPCLLSLAKTLRLLDVLHFANLHYFIQTDFALICAICNQLLTFCKVLSQDFVLMFCCYCCHIVVFCFFFVAFVFFLYLYYFLSTLFVCCVWILCWLYNWFLCCKDCTVIYTDCTELNFIEL